MTRALNSGVSGVRQFQTALDVIGNNLANINTVGFKSARADFADTLNNTLRSATPDTAARSGTSGFQLGNGVEVSGVKNSFTQGAVNQTGVVTDLAVSGEGFFVVKKSLGNGESELLVTRAGDFHLDSQGFLVTNQGLRVQGINGIIGANTDYNLVTLTAAELGDIQLNKGDLDAAVPPIVSTAEVSNINIDSTGKINVLLSDGTQYTRGQILLQKFANPNALLKQGSNLYSGLTTAGPLNPDVATANALVGALGLPPNTSGLGRIDSGQLEISNVDVAREMASMITTQRAFQANARVITSSDDMLQEIIRVVR